MHSVQAKIKLNRIKILSFCSFIIELQFNEFRYNDEDLSLITIAYYYIIMTV